MTMTVTNILEKIVEKLEIYPETLCAWLKTAKGDYRVEHLIAYLQERGVRLPFEKGDLTDSDSSETLERLNIRILARLLLTAGVPILFSPPLVDAIVRSRMYDITMSSYDFFLTHACEHQILEDRLRKSILFIKVLFVVPTLYTDRGIVAWIFDAWGGNIFTMKPYILTEKEIVQKRAERTFVSIGSKSTLESYRGEDHPFAQTITRIKKFAHVIEQTNDEHDYHAEIPAVYFP